MLVVVLFPELGCGSMGSLLPSAQPLSSARNCQGAHEAPVRDTKLSPGWFHFSNAEEAWAALVLTLQPCEIGRNHSFAFFLLVPPFEVQRSGALSLPLLNERFGITAFVVELWEESANYSLVPCPTLTAC